VGWPSRPTHNERQLQVKKNAEGANSANHASSEATFMTILGVVPRLGGLGSAHSSSDV